MNRKAVTSIRASTLRFQSLKSNFSHGAWTGRDIWPAFSVLHLLDSAEQAAGSRDTFSFDHCSGALAKCGFRWLFVACCAWNPIYHSLQGVTGWSNRRGPISMPREHPLHSEPQLPMVPAKLAWCCLILRVWFDLYTLHFYTMFRVDYSDCGFYELDSYNHICML